MVPGLFLQVGYYTSIGDILNEWAAFGFFSYLLPFLLLFALIYGILSSMQLFGAKNKSVDAIIALVVALMALQFDIVPIFFAEVFPRLGVGLAVILVLLITGGFFINPKQNGIMYTLLGIGIIVGIIVLVSTSGSLGWYSGFWWRENWPVIAGVVFIIAVLAIIIGNSGPKSGGKKEGYSLGVFRE